MFFIVNGIAVLALCLFGRRVCLAPFVVAEVTDVALYATSAWPFLCNQQESASGTSAHDDEVHKRSYQVTSHMLGQKSPS